VIAQSVHADKTQGEVEQSEGNVLMADTAIDLKEHPLMVTLQDSITGNGFVARITLSGRALMRLEDDGKWWMYGVRPAGIAASGENIEDAFLRFRGRYKDILFDIAQESASFEVFETEVERFFNEADADNEDERLWEAAFTAVRSAACTPPAPFSNLPRRSPETHPSFIKVERVDAKSKDIRLMASDNVPDTYAYSVPKAA
jgi:hypothetical protein